MSKSLTKEPVFKTYDDIIQKATGLISSFNPVVVTLDSHADKYLEKNDDKSEKVFLKQIFYGVNRYAEFNKVFTSGLFRLHPSQTNRNDANLYTIFLYLIVFRYEDLAKEELCSFLLSQDAVKMNVFLSF